jgi:hypothetical protein
VYLLSVFMDSHTIRSSQKQNYICRLVGAHREIACVQRHEFLGVQSEQTKHKIAFSCRICFKTVFLDASGIGDSSHL